MTQHPLHLLMVSSEAVPYAKTGGLADVAGALPLELAKLGHDVILLLPRYRCLNESGRSFRSVCKLRVSTPQGLVDTQIEEDVISVGQGDGRVRVWTIRNEAFFDRPGLYQDRDIDYPDNLDRFSFFCRATIEVMAHLQTACRWNEYPGKEPATNPLRDSNAPGAKVRISVKNRNWLCEPCRQSASWS